MLGNMAKVIQPVEEESPFKTKLSRLQNLSSSPSPDPGTMDHRYFWSSLNTQQFLLELMLALFK